MTQALYMAGTDPSLLKLMGMQPSARLHIPYVPQSHFEWLQIWSWFDADRNWLSQGLAGHAPRKR